MSYRFIIGWRRQYGGMKSEEAKRLKNLEAETQRLKRFVVEQALDIQTLKHLQEAEQAQGK